MKTWKLVSGILSIVLSGFVFMQSAAAGLGNALAENGELGGSAGFLVAVLLIAAFTFQYASIKPISQTCYHNRS